MMAFLRSLTVWTLIQGQNLVQPCIADDALDQWHWRNPLPNGDLLFHIAYENGIFIASGDNRAVATSVDGTNWVTSRYPPMEGLPSANCGVGSIAWANGRFIAVGGGSAHSVAGSFGIILSSPDGTNWSVPSRLQGTAGLADITASGLKLRFYRAMSQ